MRRAFYATLGVAGGVFGAAAAAVFVLGRALLGCYTSWVALPDQPICVSRMWGGNWVPVVVFAATTIMVAGFVAAVLMSLRRQFLGAHRFTRRLAVGTVATPVGLQSAAARVGIGRLQFVSSPVPLAVTVGAWRPKVLVTDSLVELLTVEELDAVLSHEALHQHHRHPAVYGLARTAASAAFPLPALRTLAQRTVLEAELTADLAATDRCGVPALIGALAKLDDACNRDMSLAMGSIGGMLSARIHALAGTPLPPPASSRGRLGVTLLSTVLLCAPAIGVAVAYLQVGGRL